MSAKYRVAIIGCGRMGATIDDEMDNFPYWVGPYAHAAGYEATPETEIVAGVDPDPEKRAAFAERYNVPPSAMFADHEEMLATIQPDIVSVATHTPLHCELSCAAAEAGVKGIYCEKPLSGSLAEAEKMIATAERYGTKSVMGTLRRWSPLWQKIRGIIHSGEIGELSEVILLTGGSLLHTNSHWLDLARWMADSEAAWVMGTLVGDLSADADKATAQDHGARGYLQFANGVHCMFAGPALYYSLDFICTGGMIRTANNGRDCSMWVPDTKLYRGFHMEVPFEMPPLASQTLGAIQDLIQAIETDTQSTCTFEDGRAAVEMALAFHVSHNAGNVRVDLPLQDKNFMVDAR